jgi:glycosyltransferase involved in cell wall biosynthesis
MIGRGQDHDEAVAKAAGAPNVAWRDWVPAAELPAVVADHDVCLGIFGTGPKALRVVPNKVYQGAAAGCAVVTSDTPPQRRAFGDAAVYVPPGDARALADAVRRLAADRSVLREMRAEAREAALHRYVPARVVDPLVARLPARGE